jgi:hypothetical protein
MIRPSLLIVLVVKPARDVLAVTMTTAGANCSSQGLHMSDTCDVCLTGKQYLCTHSLWFSILS